MSERQRPAVFAAAILVTGVLSGAAGAVTLSVIRAIQRLSYGYAQGTLLEGVTSASPVRHVVAPVLGCTLAGLGWWLLRRARSVPRLNESIREGRPFAQGPMTIDAALQVLAIGSGASLGREQAPRLFAAAGTNLVIGYTSLPPRYQRVLLGSAAGAGLAAVYSVPVAGALFTLGIVLRTWEPLAVAVAAATSSIATVTTWPISHGAPSFSWVDTHFSWKAALLGVVVLPLAAVVGSGFSRLMAWARPLSLPTSWSQAPAIGLAGLATGVCSIWLPQLAGNGKSIVLEGLGGTGTVLAFAAAALLKPALTAVFIRAGAVGGLITPALSTGVALGALVALMVNRLGGHASVATLAVIGGAVVLAIAQDAPIFAACFTAELIHPPVQIWAILILAALGTHRVRSAWATVSTRWRSRQR